MTCASCVNRIERFLRATDGVESASVNLATEIATIRYLPDVADRARFVDAVEAAGYDVRSQPERPSDATATTLAADVAVDGRASASASRASCCVQALVSIAVAIGIMVAMFVPQTRVPMETINWLALVPATIIQFWAGARFYRAAWRAARHGTANMDTLDRGRHDRGVAVQRRRDAGSRTSSTRPGSTRRRTSTRRRSSSAWSCSVAGWRLGPRPARPAPSAG